MKTIPHSTDSSKISDKIQQNWKGIVLCALIAVPAWVAGKPVPVVGGPVFAILAGMVITLFWKDKGAAASGIKFTSKVILQHVLGIW